MEQRYNLHFNRPEPTSQEINDLQDFDQLLKDFAKAEPVPNQEAVVIPLWRRYLPHTAVAASVAALLMWGLPLVNSGGDTVSAEEYFAARPFIHPPATANVPDLLAEAVVDPEEDQQIPLDDGELVLSHTALFRDRGSAIRRPVEVHYRQMDEVADYFLAGLPLAFEEDGKLKQLDAAVMLDVYATAAGETVEIAKNATIPVHLETTVLAESGENDYRLYLLDTVARKWVDVGAVKAELAAANWPLNWPSVQTYREIEKGFSDRIATANRELNAPLPARPEQPSREIGDNPTLDLDFINGLALAEGSNVQPADIERLNTRGIWEILPETDEIDNRAFDLEWEQVRLRRLGQGDKYELTLIHPQNQEVLIVRPILLDDSNYRAAMDRYHADLAKYEAAVLERDQRSDNGLASLMRERDAALANARQTIEDYAKNLPLSEQLAYQRRRADFRFNISNWGLYAVAKAITDLPSLQEISLTDSSVDADGGPHTIYVTDGKHKTLYRGLATDRRSKLPIPTTPTIWLVDEEGELSLGKIDRTSDENQLRVSQLGKLPNSVSLIKTKLGLE